VQIASSQWIRALVFDNFSHRIESSFDGDVLKGLRNIEQLRAVSASIGPTLVITLSQGLVEESFDYLNSTTRIMWWGRSSASGDDGIQRSKIVFSSSCSVYGVQ